MEHLLAYPHHASTAELVDFVYEHGEYEGEWARSSIQVCISKLNRFFLPQQLPYLRIVNRNHRYRLVLRRPEACVPPQTGEER